MKPTTQIEIGRAAPYAVVLKSTLMPKFIASKKELELQVAGYKENRMGYVAFYYDNDTRGYEEAGL